MENLHNLPPMVLCESCKAFGYCRASTDKYELSNKKRLYFLNNFKKAIPLRAIASNNLHYNNYAAATLQKAFDAYHEDDYETAILLFRMIQSDHSELREVNLYLAVSYFFQNDFENAFRFMSYYADRESGTEMISGFLDLCSGKIVHSVIVDKSTIMNASPQEQLLHA